MATNYFNIPSVSVATAEEITLLGDTTPVGHDLRTALLVSLMSAFRGPVYPPLKTVELVLACFALALPEFAKEVSSLSSLRVRVVNPTSQEVTDYLDSEVASGPTLPGLLGGVRVNLDAIVIQHPDPVYATVASLLMSVGKQPGTGPDAAGIKSRPAALANRFNISGDDLKLLPGGEFGPEINHLERIYSAFSAYTEPRMRITQFFLGIQASVGHSPRHVEILLTNFRMMRGAGMTHVGAIIALMRMHPWTVRVPDLMSYYAKFANELVEFDKIPGSVRQYHRLLVPQSDYMLVASEYKPLIAVAGSYLEEVEKSFKHYVYGADEFSVLITRVRKYEPARATFIGAGLLASRLGIQDVELPEIDEHATAPKVATV